MANKVTLTNNNGLILFETVTLCNYVTFNSTGNTLIFGMHNSVEPCIWFTLDVTQHWLDAYGALILSVRNI
jgi:hypothetical protein